MAASTDNSLLPPSVLTRAQIQQWQSFVDIELLPNLMSVYGIAAGFAPGGKEVQRHSLNKALNALRKLDDLFKGGKSFLVGESLTLADIAVVSGLTRVSAGRATHLRHLNLTRYCAGVHQHPRLPNPGEISPRPQVLPVVSPDQCGNHYPSSDTAVGKQGHSPPCFQGHLGWRPAVRALDGRPVRLSVRDRVELLQPCRVVL